MAKAGIPDIVAQDGEIAQEAVVLIARESAAVGELDGRFPDIAEVVVGNANLIHPFGPLARCAADDAELADVVKLAVVDVDVHAIAIHGNRRTLRKTELEIGDFDVALVVDA
ncbi:MAG: hypothetical protein ACOC4K_01045, partial [Verrucomicrobiota bacterium]